MKKVWKVASLAILSIAVVFTSCNEEEQALNAVGDAYVIKKKVDDEMAYGTAYYLYANKSLSNVSVSTADGMENNLSVLAGSSFTFYLEPDSSDFTTEVPLENEIVFDVVATSGENLKVNESLEFDDLEIPEIEETSYDSIQESHTINWSIVEECEGYMVKVFTTDGNLIFASSGINSDSEEFELSSTMGTWKENPSNGTTYKIQVQAFSYESNSITELVYNLKEIGIGEENIVWGE